MSKRTNNVEQQNWSFAKKKNNAVWIEDGSFHEAKFETCIKF